VRNFSQNQVSVVNSVLNQLCCFVIVRTCLPVFA
jgi:hypothetical protein